MLTIGRLARKFGLSRSTLLYYDSIGLLSPSERSKSGYRLYTREDIARLQRIRLYRDSGVALQDIKHILEHPASDAAGVLERRFEALEQEISALRRQQQLLARLLRQSGALAPPTRERMSKELWVGVLRAAGFSEEDMWQWHASFESASPEEHQRFLEYLSLPESEIQRIRGAAAKVAENRA